MSKRKFFFNIDVLGVCNLACPSCPTGNMRDPRRQKGLMEPTLLDRILEKAAKECEVTGVGLFNWTEPLLHPQLPQLIRIVETRGMACHLSSNLNVMKNIDAVLEANPHSLRLSISGFTQEVYGYTHRGGDIELVKSNMVSLARALDRTKARTEVHVLYHRYKGNLEDEPLMREFARSLGFRFEPVWAMMMPIEKILAYANEPSAVSLNPADHQLINHLALPLGKALGASRKAAVPICVLQDEQMTIDHRGNVALCCGVYDPQFNLGHYLEHSIDDLQTIKHKQDICTRCMSQGVHAYITYAAPELDLIAASSIDPRHEKLLRLRYERIEKRIRGSLTPIYHRYVSAWISPKRAKRLANRLRLGIRAVEGLVSATKDVVVRSRLR